MTFGTDISGKTFYLYGMEPIVISAQTDEERQTPVQIRLFNASDDTVLSESYFFGFDGMVSIDISDVLERMFSHAVPDRCGLMTDGGLAVRLNIAAALTVDEDETQEISADFTVLGMDSMAAEKTSDIDMLRIPRDYILPLAVFDSGLRSGVEFVTPYRRYPKMDWLPTAGTMRNVMSMFVDLSDFPSELLRSFRVEYSGTSPVLSTPQFRMCPGHFEQYLFANRYGGYDNIAMDGRLEYVLETEHETGVYSGKLQGISCSCEDSFLQESGYVSRKTVRAMQDLICSRQIYHYENGRFRQILVTESDISCSSDDTLHSFSFRYRYAGQQ